MNYRSGFLGLLLVSLTNIGRAQAPRIATSLTTPSVETDSSVYVAQRGQRVDSTGKIVWRWVDFTIGVRYTNNHQTPVYIAADCEGPNRPKLQWKRGNEWLPLFPGVPGGPIVREALCMRLPLVVIWPGGTYHQLYAYQIFLPLTGERADLATSHRLVWKLGVSEDYSNPSATLRLFPEDELTSNEFTIVVK